MDIIFWIHELCKWYSFCWCFSGLFCMVSRDFKDLGWLARWSSRFISETKPFYFVFVGGFYVTHSLLGKFHWYTPFFFALDVATYYVFKKYGDDDRWNKRIEKFSEKVEVSEGKLVVVPTN